MLEKDIECVKREKIDGYWINRSKKLFKYYRYRWITDRIKESIDAKWLDIDTSNKQVNEIYQ